MEWLETKDGIRLAVEGTYPIGNWKFYFTHNKANESERKLLYHNLLSSFYDHLEAIRRGAYEQGWADAKAKRKKRTWFSRQWKEPV